MTDSHDPWEAARERQREQVQAIFAARESAPVEDRRRDFRLGRRGKRIVGAGLLVLVAACALIVPGLRDSAAEQRRAARAKQAKLEAGERARLRVDARPRRVAGPAPAAGESVLAHRPRLVHAGETAISADARARVKAGTVDGPVAGTQCATYPDTATRAGQEDDPALAAGRYECVAYEREIPLSELNGEARTGIIGVPYWLVIDYRSSALTFCKITPRAGEGGRSLAYVPVPVPCRDPQRAGG